MTRSDIPRNQRHGCGSDDADICFQRDGVDSRDGHSLSEDMCMGPVISPIQESAGLKA